MGDRFAGNIFVTQAKSASYIQRDRKIEYRQFVIFGHAHLDSRTDSRALRAEHCIVGIPHNTAI